MTDVALLNLGSHRFEPPVVSHDHSRHNSRLERQFLTWARTNGISDVEQIDQRAIERYQAHLFASGLRTEKLSTFTVNSYVRTLNAG